jgi:ABC-type branched-subunit amino acid transport system substrate-binding protein/serine/threonine protein kinase
MDIYCTRPHCEQPLNSFSDLDESKFLESVDRQYCANCGMPLILDGRYAPLKLLKQDESAATFLSCDLYTPKLTRCTIEQLRIDPSFNATQLEIVTQLFCREAEVLEKLGKHPNIPRLFAFLELVIAADPPDRQQKFFYLVQKQIEGQSLEEELLRKEKFVESEVIFILREVARILEFVHFQDAIHRDLKPSNIIRDAQGKIYLINFGAVRQIVAETIRVTAGQPDPDLNLAATLASTAGNQFQGQEIYPSSDLYSLAVTCLNLLTGKQPQDLLDLETNNWQWRTPDLQVSDSLAEILDKMLQNEPAERFQSARDILDALDTIWGMPILSISTASNAMDSTLLSGIVDRKLPQLDDDRFALDDDFLQLDYDLFQLDDDISQLEHSSIRIVTQKNVQHKKFWIIGGVLAAGLVGLSAMIVPKLLLLFKPIPTMNDTSKQEVQTTISRRSSMGERILLGLEGNRDTDKFKELKRAGVVAIASKNYSEAVTNFQAALVENPNSPETRIYLNNALVGDRKSYTIATAAPIERSLDRASEMLRGFAQAQAEINQTGDINEPKIKLRIIDDGDDPKVIESIANGVVNRPEILGIVGHNRNDISVKAANIYNRHQLAFVAPISTANKLTGKDKPYIFRTNGRADSIASKLVDHLINVDRKRKVAIFYVPSISYNDEFKNQFVKKLTAKKGEVVGTFSFSRASSSAAPTATPAPIFDAEAHLQKAKEMGAEAILLLPVGRSSREALKVLKIRSSKYPELDVLSDTSLYSLNTLNAGNEAKGLVMGVPWLESESTAQFSVGARQLWNHQVNWVTATSYNSVKALGAAIKAQDIPSRTGVMNILAKNEFMGAAGRFQFKNGEPTEKYILVIVAPTPPNYQYSSRTGYDFVPIEWLF